MRVRAESRCSSSVREKHVAPRLCSGRKPGARSRKAVFFALLLLCATQAFAQSLAPIRYTVSFPAPHTHYAEVEALVPTEGRDHVELMMAVWTPGSYMVREYARHVESFRASDPSGVALGVEKTRKNRWRVKTGSAKTGGAKTVRINYKVYAREMSVRTNWIDDEFALLNGAPTFVTLLESPSRRAHEVRLVLPKTWARSFSAMPSADGTNTYTAPDYDTLVDSPILAGTPAVHEFQVAGKAHFLVDFGERGVWTGSQAMQDLARVGETALRFWGQAPFDRYHFFNIIGAPLNALEHKNSTVIHAPRESTETRAGYLEWLSTAAHEYFHAWNAKRLRPVELGPFDYEGEVYTTNLWFVEGVTSYYGDLLLPRSGVATPQEYLRALSSEIRSLQTTPGRLVQSVETASYDAWIKYYRPDENSANSAISYYVKGAVIGFLLDAKLRRATNGARSLDDVMRLMYERFSGERGFTAADLRDAVIHIGGQAHAREMRSWLDHALQTTAELDYEEALDWFGLRLMPPAEAPRPWLGLAVRTDRERTFVSEVRRGSPAFTAALSVGDEITALNGAPIRAGGFAAQVEEFAPDSQITLSLLRSNVPSDVKITLGTDPGHRWALSVSKTATRDQERRLAAWLGTEGR